MPAFPSASSEPDLDVLEVHVDQLAGDHDAVVGLHQDDRVGLDQVVGGGRIVDDGEGIDLSGPRDGVLLDLADTGTAALRAEVAPGEVLGPAVPALGPLEVVPSGDLPPLSRYRGHQIASRMLTVTAEPVPPVFCASPYLAFSTCLLSADPLSCSTSSTIWATPVAPMG